MSLHSKPRVFRVWYTTVIPGEALIGVSVLEVGTTNGTITDFDGKYTLKVSSNKVSFSYVGFKTEIVNVTNSGTYNVNLVSDNELDEVVVIGYGTQRKSDLTGAFGFYK